MQSIELGVKHRIYMGVRCRGRGLESTVQGFGLKK